MSWFEDALKRVCNAAESGQGMVTAMFEIMDQFPAQHFLPHGSDDQNNFLVVEHFLLSFYFKIVSVSSFLNLRGKDLLRM